MNIDGWPIGLVTFLGDDLRPFEVYTFSERSKQARGYDIERGRDGERYTYHCAVSTNTTSPLYTDAAGRANASFWALPHVNVQKDSTMRRLDRLPDSFVDTLSSMRERGWIG